MLKKAFRELHDGLGTVEIKLKLPMSRLAKMQEKAEQSETSVDSAITDAITHYLVQADIETRKGGLVVELPRKVEELEKENQILRLQIDQLSKKKRRNRKPTESPDLQIYLPLTISGILLEAFLSESLAAG